MYETADETYTDFIYTPLRLYPAEITPLSIRAPANAIATTANWLFNFLVVMVTPIAFANIQYKTYIIFAVINFAIVPSVYFFFPETMGRSLEEMDEIFHRTTGAFDVVGIAKEMPHRYGRKGELLIDYEDTERARETERRRSSVVGAGVGVRGVMARESKGEREFVEKTEVENEGSSS